MVPSTVPTYLPHHRGLVLSPSPGTWAASRAAAAGASWLCWSRLCWAQGSRGHGWAGRQPRACHSPTTTGSSLLFNIPGIFCQG